MSAVSTEEPNHWPSLCLLQTDEQRKVILISWLSTTPNTSWKHYYFSLVSLLSGSHNAHFTSFLLSKPLIPSSPSSEKKSTASGPVSPHFLPSPNQSNFLELHHRLPLPSYGEIVFTSMKGQSVHLWSGSYFLLSSERSYIHNQLLSLSCIFSLSLLDHFHIHSKMA